MRITLFVFRRDFRLKGNPAWARAVRHCRKHGCALVPCFIYSDLQIDPKKNAYFSALAYSAMREAIDAVDRSLGGRLSLFRTPSSDTLVLDAVRKEHDLVAVFYNSDVTPFARERDRSIQSWCDANGVECYPGDPGDGYLIWTPGSILTKSTKTIPKTFHTFYKYSLKKNIETFPDVSKLPDIRKVALRGFAPADLPPVADTTKHSVHPPHEIMRRIRSGGYDSYGDTRDDYSSQTTRMSVHLKFGTLDPKEVFAAVRERKSVELERQLVWREFYYHLAYGYPKILSSPNSHIRPDRNRIKWGKPDRDAVEKWSKGQTGEELVDQAMQKLNDTGYIHNRLRMVVASYFVRDMATDWRIGERIFATKLIDYDPAQNSGGWQSMDSQVPGQEIKASTQIKKYGNVT